MNGTIEVLNLSTKDLEGILKTEQLSGMALNDWSISKELLDWMNENIPEGSTILELGSGEGTAELAKKFKMYSVEHNRKFLNKHNSTYIYAPIKNGWFDIPWSELPVNYDVLLIDGPTGDIGRFGFVDHLDRFKKNVVIIVDDTNRAAERKLSKVIKIWKGNHPIIVKGNNKQTDIYL